MAKLVLEGTTAPLRKIAAIKSVRAFMSWGLKDTKLAIDEVVAGGTLELPLPDLDQARLVQALGESVSGPLIEALADCGFQARVEE